MDGLVRLTNFLGFLKSKKIAYRLDHFSDEGVMVTFFLPAKRVEVEFFSDHLDFETFSAGDGVYSNEADLMKLIAENWD